MSCRIFMLHAIGSVRRIAGVFRFRKENQKCGCPVPRSTVRAWSDNGRSGCVRCQSGGLTRIPMHMETVSCKPVSRHFGLSSSQEAETRWRSPDW
ncbi:hypothetical protein HMPREF1326_02138 [Akkermansia sp. KLE1605]|nr:hypothetical protein HMPREF1326_02138 [Akkermansia sp. KLE1605]